MTHAVLQDLRALDVGIEIRGNRLRLDAPRGVLTPGLIEQVRQQKTAILKALASNSAHLPKDGYAQPADPNVARIIELWSEDTVERFQERAAIREFDGGMERDLAERAALEDVDGEDGFATKAMQVVKAFDGKIIN